MSVSSIFKISVLVFLKDRHDRLLLIKRQKSPNLGCWSPPGGKLEMSEGESPFQCAIRETHEETGHELELGDLHLFGIISEKNYEGSGHWLMFLFDCLKPINAVPETIDEGHFQFFSRREIDELALPPTDRKLLWPWYDGDRTGFVALQADCDPHKNLEIVIEQRH